MIGLSTSMDSDRLHVTVMVRMLAKSKFTSTLCSFALTFEFSSVTHRIGDTSQPQNFSDSPTSMCSWFDE